MNQLLILNPGSTSTKVAVYEDMEMRFTKTIRHQAKDLEKFSSIYEQHDFRMEVIRQTLSDAGYADASFVAVIAIGGLLKNVASGVYIVNDAMLEDLKNHKYGEHAANLGAILANDFSKLYHIPAYIGDPITVDEMQDIARISGHPLVPRYGRTHTLNHKRIAFSVSKEMGKKYEDCRLIIAHLGGGVSIGAHAGGRIIDSTSSRGEGAFSMDRSGQLNSWELAKLCFSGKYEKSKILKMLNGNGGVSSYLGTKDFREVEQKMNDGNEQARLVFEALAYQVAKEIGSMATVLEGKLDAIVITGGIAYSEAFLNLLIPKIQFIGKIIIKAGEEEMESLSFYLNSVLDHTMIPKEYE